MKLIFVFFSFELTKILQALSYIVLNKADLKPWANLGECKKRKLEIKLH
jgi:hypothetical protein